MQLWIRYLFCSSLIFQVKIGSFTRYRIRETKDQGRPRDPRTKLLSPHQGKYLCDTSRVKPTSGHITQGCALSTIRNTQNYVWPCHPRWLHRVLWVPGSCDAQWGLQLPAEVCRVSSSWAASGSVRVPGSFHPWTASKASSRDGFPERQSSLHVHKGNVLALTFSGSQERRKELNPCRGRV